MKPIVVPSSSFKSSNLHTNKLNVESNNFVPTKNPLHVWVNFNNYSQPERANCSQIYCVKKN